MTAKPTQASEPVAQMKHSTRSQTCQIDTSGVTVVEEGMRGLEYCCYLPGLLFLTMVALQGSPQGAA